MSVSEKVLDAIQLLASSSVEKAEYDKTIQAQIVSCEDAAVGKYRCRYQDAIFYAYANNTDITLSEGAYVYVLVPGNDMSNEKTILGTTKKLGTNYISLAEGDEAYDKVGNNCVTSNQKYYLDSSIDNYSYVIYGHKRENGLNLGVDIESLTKYLKESSSLLVGATFKTSIPPARQYKGHYGIKFNLRFLDNTSNNDVIKSYVIDQDNMIDNPYRLTYETRQYQIFDIDGINFKDIESIEIFCKDFPQAMAQEKNLLLSAGDIEISALEIYGTVRMAESEINGVAISFYTPQGTFFTDESVSTSYKTITAQVRIKGKMTSTQSIPFYWGIENVGISASSQYYNKYLGRGWKCLNEKNVLSSGTDTTDPIIQWVPNKDTYIMYFTEATARDNKLKVAIFYDGNVVSKEINIQNLAANVPKITIESSEGTKFYYDIGHPTLTCFVNNSQPANFHYNWAYENSGNVLENLPETTALNVEYQEAVAALKTLEHEIAIGTKFEQNESENLLKLKTLIKDFDFIQRVEGNKIHDVQIHNITKTGTFKCSVYNQQNNYLGTASITLTNSLEGQSLYSLIINNGSAVYQYNENGVAPNSKSLDSQQEIQSLSFTIYDNLGNPIDESVIKNSLNCQVRWFFPIADTMLVDQSQNGDGQGTDAERTYKYYDNLTNLVYGIAQKYDLNKQRNQIKLTVNYKGISLTAETNFTFSKQGQPGTNGTEFLVKIVPNTKMDDPPNWSMITKAGDQYILNYGLNNAASETRIGSGISYQLFKAQLWRSGELVWQGSTAALAAIDGTTKPSLVHWSVLVNKYNSNTFDDSAFTVTNAEKGYIAYEGDFLQAEITQPKASIIKCEIVWQGKSYYGTIPITLAWTSSRYYKINLKDYTGWRYAIYTSDGMTPQYDSAHPFEFIVKENIYGTWEDISLVRGDHQLTYLVKGIGTYKDTKTGEAINANLIEVLNSSAYRDGLSKNQWQARPASRYDGVCINAAIYCICSQNGVQIAKIVVPIHFLLNKYGLANINAWDGNSVQLDDEGGFILAPQMGSGKKEDDNSFTGVLMGETRTPGKSTSQIGLLGYNQGDRTFFLNSRNGAAIFGKANKGQIIIDPTSPTQNALLYSGDVWDKYYDDGENEGLPTSYVYRNDRYKPAGNAKRDQNGKITGGGLIIDLTTPEIYFGTGHFYVTKDGYLHASAGGDLAGWTLGEEKEAGQNGAVITRSVLHSNISRGNGRITLDAGVIDDETGEVIGPGKFYSHSHVSLNSTSKGFYLSHDGLSIGNKFKVTDTGVLYIGNNATGYGGTQDGNYWTINGDGSRSYISYGGSASFNKADNKDDKTTAAKVYLGTDGISLGNKFSVNPLGQLIAYNGTIGGWTIGRSSLSAKNLVLNSEGSISGGSTYQWSIASGGTATFSRLLATGGTIGGWNIKSDRLQAGDLKLHSTGGINGKGWSISSTGIAYFKHIYGEVAENKIFIAGGTRFSSGGSGGTTTLPTGGSTKVGGKTLENYVVDTIKAHTGIFDKVITEKLDAGMITADIIKFKGPEGYTTVAKELFRIWKAIGDITSQ